MLRKLWEKVPKQKLVFWRRKSLSQVVWISSNATSNVDGQDNESNKNLIKSSKDAYTSHQILIWLIVLSI
jgi:hypothetical protein